MAPPLIHAAHLRSNAYDADWLLSLNMGPNPLWLLEDLLADVPLEQGMRVLDLGCGKGASSIFLVREHGVEVWATDLWIPGAERQAVFDAAGVSELVHVEDGEARHLPFEDDAFDAVVCIDAWEYFGTDDHALPAVLRVLRPGGRIGMATPAMRTSVRELDAIPDHIASVVGWEALTWRTAAWWEQQWRLGGFVDAIVARLQPDGWHDWLRWERAVVERGDDRAQRSVEMLETDGGRLLTFAIVSATKR